MRKPFWLSPCSRLMTVLFLLAVCSLFLEKSILNEAFSASFETQQMAPAAKSEGTESGPPKRPLIHPEVLRIPAIELRDLLAKKADIVVVDVNPKDWFDSWHIPSAINIPFNSMDGAASRERKLKKIPVGKLIVLYCLCEEGVDSSEEALELRSLGHAWNRVKVLEGGLSQWDAKGYPMIKQEIPQ